MKVFLCMLWFLVSCPLGAAIIIGNPNGDIVVTEIFDYQCVHCQHMSSVMGDLMVAHPRLKLRLLPIGMNSLSMRQAIFVTEQALSADDFLSIHARFMQGECHSLDELNDIMDHSHHGAVSIDSHAIKESLSEGYQTMHQYHANEVPFFIVNNGKNPIIFNGEQSYETLDRLLILLEKGGEIHVKKNR